MSKRKVVNKSIKEKETIKQKKLCKLKKKIELIWAFLSIVGIVIGGLNQYNQTIVGTVAICEGLLGVLFFISYIKLFKIGFIPTTNTLDILLESNYISFDNKDIYVKYEEELKTARLGYNIFLGCIMFFSIMFISVGILKLFGII